MRQHAPLSGDTEADVCVIGGGITGLTAALALVDAGKSVVLIERHRIGQGVTGSTTAHLTTLIDLDWHRAVDRLGVEGAQRVHASVRHAIEHIDGRVKELGVDCDFRRTVAYQYAVPDGDADVVKKNADALRVMGMAVKELDRAPLPFENGPALEVADQARFHPLRYLDALAEAAVERGVRIFEDTRALQVSNDEPCVVETDRGAVRAAHVVYATHTPAGVHLVQTEMHDARSYVLALKVRGELPEGLFFDTASPYRYLRAHEVDGEPLWIVGGADHQVGRGDPREAIASLEAWARDAFEVATVEHRWSAQVYETGDGLPYIGWRPGHDRHVIATGFAGDGMTFGTVGGLVARDLIVHGENRWEDLYRPSRISMAAAKTMVEKGLVTVKDLLGRRLKRDADEVSEIGRGEGKLVVVDGQKLAVCRDEAGTLHACSATCPHLGCVVHWNGFERSWDCACHGSRFGVDGAVLGGPSTKDLEKVELSGADRAAE